MTPALRSLFELRSKSLFDAKIISLGILPLSSAEASFESWWSRSGRQRTQAGREIISHTPRPRRTELNEHLRRRVESCPVFVRLCTNLIYFIILTDGFRIQSSQLTRLGN